MRHPFQGFPTGTSSVLLAVLAGATLFLMWKLNKIDKLLNIPNVVPNGIISLEFAGSSAKAKAIVDAWCKGNVLDQAQKLQSLDFLYIGAYSTTLSLSCIWVTKSLTNFDGEWIGAGVVLGWGQWVAALLDVIENLTLFPFLYGEVKDSSPLARVAAVCAVFKFSLIFTGLLYLLTSIVIKLILII
ncbi:hypothetical protein WKK05_38670 (plasmid) [Nostoc sp. UHCC 0302]|uniref:hypothetical protein n=1 Tax=Nostoc sp. UHCC 0302 TaxID=3134896 RepID=UPI00311C9888